jgi:hypothetical protein
MQTTVEELGAGRRVLSQGMKKNVEEKGVVRQGKGTLCGAAMDCYTRLCLQML